MFSAHKKVDHNRLMKENKAKYVYRLKEVTSDKITKVGLKKAQTDQKLPTSYPK